jgi:hypothetical protein
MTRIVSWCVVVVRMRGLASPLKEHTQKFCDAHTFGRTKDNTVLPMAVFVFDFG